VLGDEADLDEDSDHDGLPDVWEYAHSPNQSLDDFGGATQRSALTTAAAEPAWVSPYAPREVDWVPVSASDWDGDGVSDGDEYRRWRSRAVDGDGLPYDPTFINAPRSEDDSGCGAASTSGWWGACVLGLGLLFGRRREG